MIPRNSLVLIYTSIWNATLPDWREAKRYPWKSTSYLIHSFPSLFPILSSDQLWIAEQALILTELDTVLIQRLLRSFRERRFWTERLWVPCFTCRTGRTQNSVLSLGKKKWSSSLHTRRPDSFKFSFTHVFDFDKIQFTSRLHRLARVSFDYASYHYPLIGVV